MCIEEIAPKEPNGLGLLDKVQSLFLNGTSHGIWYSPVT